MSFFQEAKPVAKAVAAFFAPGVVAISGALTVGSDGGGQVTTYEWITALIACLVTSGLVYATPNRSPLPADEDLPPRPEEAEAPVE